MDFKFVGTKRTGICYLVEVLEIVVNPSLIKIKSQAYSTIFCRTMKEF